jgi:hypothetical protein
MSFRPKRFDVAGAHPDEAWRAVDNIRTTVDDIRRQFIGSPQIGEVNTMIWPYLEIENRPMRFGNTPDAEVQRYLARGVELVDKLKAKMPLGLSRGQEQVRDRCHELAKSMQKVLDRRPDEEQRPRQTFRPKPKARM